jgi:hypothetical protein
MDPSPLAGWENFYVIVGSAAGALTGLQFVVITLVAQSRNVGSMTEVRAFGSPTVVHFCFALLLSGIVTAPWRSLGGPAIALAICGLAGFAYSASIIRHARRQTGYQADAEDWFWYILLPLLDYAVLVIAAILLRLHHTAALFAVAITALLLLFNGIHNSWDTVTWVVVHHPQQASDDRQQQ